MKKLLAGLNTCQFNCFLNPVLNFYLPAFLLLGSASFAMASNYGPNTNEAQSYQQQGSKNQQGNTYTVPSFNNINSSPINPNFSLDESIKAKNTKSSQDLLKQDSIGVDKKQPQLNFNLHAFNLVGYHFTNSTIFPSNLPLQDENHQEQLPKHYQDFLSSDNYGQESDSLFALSTVFGHGTTPILLQTDTSLDNKVKSVSSVESIFENTCDIIAPSSSPNNAFANLECEEQDVIESQNNYLNGVQNLAHYEALGNNLKDQYVEHYAGNQSASLEKKHPDALIDLEQASKNEHALENKASQAINKEQARNALSNRDDEVSSLAKDNRAQPSVKSDNHIDNIEYTYEFIVDNFFTQTVNDAHKNNLSDDDLHDDEAIYDAYDEYKDSEEINHDRVYNQKDRVFYASNNPQEARELFKDQSAKLNKQEDLSVSELFDLEDDNGGVSGNVQANFLAKPPVEDKKKPKTSLEQEIAKSNASNVTKSVLGAQLLSEKSITLHTHEESDENQNTANNNASNYDDDNNFFDSYEESIAEQNKSSRIYYSGTRNPKQEQEDLNQAILDFKEQSQHNNYTEDSYYGHEEIDVDPSVNLDDLKSYKEDDNTFFYQFMHDSEQDNSLAQDEHDEGMDHDDPTHHMYAHDESSHKEEHAKENLSRDDIYRQNLLEHDLQTYGPQITARPNPITANSLLTEKDNVEKDINTTDGEEIPYWQKNSDWEIKQTLDPNDFANDYAQSKEEAAIYGNFSLDISTHHYDYIDDIDVSRIADYVIATNEEGVSPIAKRVLTRTRITSYALRFSDNPFLAIDDLQREQSACLNGKGYSCYLVGRHYDGLASLGRNNKRRMTAASELAKAHELYPHISITGSDFDHLLHTVVFYRRGCHLKHSLSCRLLLSAYGRFGGLIALGKTTVGNRNLGVRYLEAGCHFEEPRSCANLAAMHLNGYGNFEANSKKGIGLYVRSCRIARTITNELRVIDPNLGIGCLELGRMYLNSGLFKDGTYIQQDYVKAHHYLHHACNLRSAAACQMLKDNFTKHEHIEIPLPIGETFKKNVNMNKQVKPKQDLRSSPLNLLSGTKDLWIFDRLSKLPALYHNIVIQP